MIGRVLLLIFALAVTVLSPTHALGSPIQTEDATSESPFDSAQVLPEPMNTALLVARHAPDPATRKRHNRLLLTGTLVGWLLSELAVLFGYLKVEHATRGFYSGRLQTFAGAGGLAVFATACFFYFTWMAR